LVYYFYLIKSIFPDYLQNPLLFNKNNIPIGHNFINGEWQLTKRQFELVDPIYGDIFMKLPDTQIEELDEIKVSMSKVPKSGLHNPFRNVNRYKLYGEIMAEVSRILRDESIMD